MNVGLRINIEPVVLVYFSTWINYSEQEDGLEEQQGSSCAGGDACICAGARVCVCVCKHIGSAVRGCDRSSSLWENVVTLWCQCQLHHGEQWQVGWDQPTEGFTQELGKALWLSIQLSLWPFKPGVGTVVCKCVFRCENVCALFYR